MPSLVGGVVAFSFYTFCEWHLKRHHIARHHWRFLLLILPRFLRQLEMELPIAIGKTISNETFVVDLAKMPHMLMAGATGQGKSVGLNAVPLNFHFLLLILNEYTTQNKIG